MISFVTRLPSVIFTRGRWRGGVRKRIKGLEAASRAIDPRPERRDESFQTKEVITIQVLADEIMRLQDKIKEIEVVEKERDEYLEEIEDTERDVARWEVEAKRIKDKLRNTLASHSSITSAIQDVKVAIQDVKKQMSSITGSGSQSLEDDLRHLENQRIDLEMDLGYSWQKIEQLHHELWGVNQSKQSHQKRIDSALVEISKLNREIETLKENLPVKVNEILVGRQTDLKEWLMNKKLYPAILDDPVFGPILRGALKPIEL